MISVIIPTYNAAGPIEECLKSLVSQKTKAMEIILVDSSSTDETLKKAERYADRILKIPQGRRPAIARNRGAEVAAGDLFIFVDSDVVLRRDSIEKAISSLAEYNLDAISGVYSDDAPRSNFLSELQNLILIYRFSHPKKDAGLLNSAFCAIKKEVFNKAGGFDERMVYYEDIELGHRLFNVGCRLRLDPSLRVTHLKRFCFKSLINDYFKKSLSSGQYRKRGFLNKLKIDGVPLSIKIAGVSSFAIFATLPFVTIKPVLPLSSLIIYTLFLLPVLGFLCKRRGLLFSAASYCVLFFVFLASFLGLAYGF
ncbi:MAG: glycosyltransferase, partial [Candidatus Omnitrophica bacterium]|nr:glycosyltransferase [Candidatus Omnitrophota bacterium]